MAKVNYNGTASAGASATVAPENAARRSFFFRTDTDMTLNFGSAATASNILTVKAGASIYITAHDPYPIDKQINVYCASASAYQAQAEE